jgi:hypothetical protein
VRPVLLSALHAAVVQRRGRRSRLAPLAVDLVIDVGNTPGALAQVEEGLRLTFEWFAT